MKVNKFNFLKVLGKHLANKLGATSTSYDENILASSLAPSFTMYEGVMKSKGIMDESGLIDLDMLESHLDGFFKYIPMLNFPIGSMVLSITKEDVNAFITEVEKYGIVEDVIYLPAQN